MQSTILVKTTSSFSQPSMSQGILQDSELISEDSVDQSDPSRLLLVSLLLLVSRHDINVAELARDALASLEYSDRARVLLGTAVLEDSGLGRLDVPRRQPGRSPEPVSIPYAGTFNDPDRLATLVNACDPRGTAFGDNKWTNEQRALAALESQGIYLERHDADTTTVDRGRLVSTLAMALAKCPRIAADALNSVVAPTILEDAHATSTSFPPQSPKTGELASSLMLLTIFLVAFLATGLGLGYLLTSEF